MPVVLGVLQALQILAPLIEELVTSLSNGKTPDFLSALPEPLKSRVALNVREHLNK